MTIKAIIVEDEQEGIENLTLKIEKYCPQITIIDKCETGEKAIKSIQEKKPHIVFLDILLGTMTGFDVLKYVAPIPFEIIFTTSYDEYMIEAIRHSAVDYILKPIRPSELIEAVNRAIKRIQLNQPMSRILIPDGNNQLVLHTKNITYCIADNVNTYIHRNEGKKTILAVKTLKTIESMLPAKYFHRVSRSAIVNLDFVEAIYRSQGGYVKMMNGKELSVSKARLDEFLQKIGNNF